MEWLVLLLIGAVIFLLNRMSGATDALTQAEARLDSERATFEDRIAELERQFAHLRTEVGQLRPGDEVRRVSGTTQVEVTGPSPAIRAPARAVATTAPAAQARPAPKPATAPAINAPAVAQPLRPPAPRPSPIATFRAPAAPTNDRPVPTHPPEPAGPTHTTAELEEVSRAPSGWVAFEDRDRKRLAEESASQGPRLRDRVLRHLGVGAPVPGQGITTGALQDWVESRGLAVAGGLALLLCAVFYLSLAFTNGWITEPMRVGIGLLAGAGLMVLGELTFSRLRGILGHVLVAVGLAILELAFFAGARLYGLFPVEVGLAAALVAAIAAAVIAIRHDAQVVAAYGLIAVLVAPPVLGASPTMVTVLFVAATLVGTTVISLFRTWIWLPGLAFILAAPQVATYLAGAPALGPGLAAVAGFWLINLIAAGGEETRHRTEVLRPATVLLLLADAAFTLWAAFQLSPEAWWRASFTLALGVAHFDIGLYFLLRFHDRHPFGLVVAATGVAAIAMAVPILNGGFWIPIAWAGESAALAWVAVVRRHPYSAAIATLLGTMAGLHLVAMEYPLTRMATWAAPAVPFTGAGGEGWVFLSMLAALLVAGLMVRLVWLRVGLAAMGWLLALYVLPFELDGSALVAAWSALGAAGMVIFQRVIAPRLPDSFREAGVPSLRIPASVAPTVTSLVVRLSEIARPLFLGAACLASAAAIAHLVAFEYPPDRIGTGLAGTPFGGPPAVATGAVLVALAATGALIERAWVRAGVAALGILLAIYVLPFEVSDTALVGAWAALAATGLVIDHRIVEPRLRSTATHASGSAAGLAPMMAMWVEPAFLSVATLAGACAIGHLVTFEYPVTNTSGYERTIPFGTSQGLAFGFVLVALAVAAALVRVAWVRVALGALAGALALWVFPFELSGPGLVWAWGVLAVIAVMTEARVVQPLAGTGFPGDSQVPAVRSTVRHSVRALAALTGVAMIVHLVRFDFPVERLGGVPLSAVPFAGPEGASLGAILAAMTASGWLLGQRWIRLGLAGLGLAIVVYATGFELPAPHVTVAWGVLAALSVGIVRRLVRLDLAATSLANPLRAIGERAPFGAAALAVLFILAQASVAAPLANLLSHVAASAPPSDRLFLDDASYVLGVLAATCVAIGLTWGVPRFLVRGGIAAALAIAWLLPFEIRPGYAAAGWLALATAGAWLVRVREVERPLVAAAAVSLGLAGAVVDLLVVAPPTRLVVDASTFVPGWTYLTDATVGLGALTISLGLVGWLYRATLVGSRALLGAGLALVYLLSVDVVDWFQREAYGGSDLATSQRLAQAGLSILWGVLGCTFFAAGVIRTWGHTRIFGLALLGLTTVKVFLIDLVGLAIEGRVAVLLALGVLLLLSSFVYTRLQHPQGPKPSHA